RDLRSLARHGIPLSADAPREARAAEPHRKRLNRRERFATSSAPRLTAPAEAGARPRMGRVIGGDSAGAIRPGRFGRDASASVGLKLRRYAGTRRQRATRPA